MRKTILRIGLIAVLLLSSVVIVKEVTLADTTDKETVADTEITVGDAEGSAVQDTVTIADEETPKSRWDGKWAVANLVLMLITAAESCMMTFAYFMDRPDYDAETFIDHMDEDEEDEFHENELTKRKEILRSLSIPVTTVAIIEFILTEDMSFPMVAVDKYTFIMAVFAVINSAFLVFSSKRILNKQIE